MATAPLLPGDGQGSGVNETVAGLVAPGVTEFAERTALRSAGDPERTYDYDRLRTEAHKTGNLLSHEGVRDGRRVGVADDPVPETVLTFLGAALTGAVVRFDPPGEFDGRAVVVPVGRVDDYDLPPGGRRIAYGGAPTDPAVVHFEEEMWSENPTFPPPAAAPTDPLLSTGTETLSHGEVVDAARQVVDEYGLGPDAVVALRSDLARPGAVVAGVVAPLAAGATVLLPAEDDASAATHLVTAGEATVPTVDPGRWP